MAESQSTPSINVPEISIIDWLSERSNLRNYYITPLNGDHILISALGQLLGLRENEICTQIQRSIVDDSRIRIREISILRDVSPEMWSTVRTTCSEIVNHWISGI